MLTTDTSSPVALITGTSSGFGLESTIALAKEGYIVIATMRNLEKQARLLQRAEQEGVSNQITVMKLDVRIEQEIEETVNAIIEKEGRIDLLLNNAGYALRGTMEETPLHEWRSILETNLYGVIAMTQAVLPVMRKQQSGKIINVSSALGFMGLPTFAAYSASKFAVEGFSESLRLEALPLGIYISLIEPGSFQTDIVKNHVTVKSEDSPYYQVVNGINRMESKGEGKAGNPKKITGIVLRIARARAPKFRWVMGKDAKGLYCVKQILAWRWLEKIVLRVLTSAKP
ncbi:SDR family NAD(P)-dependent oxidoreductase [Marininema halotolerans]|uniref:NADP-dependent 3-hydroxy acid dehydrogenase YdfG n=1 Tax=Marininema halotolerans TaxID=1155944 RepID=A0A1I6R916_9BACL|nr:SDR family NAD(P)-dependent oxidoreductase [Marininema halotolerans]SFS61030.1 NADP-dependent 3-hydroxy acid dehydrogenase YdfG [Marininema halotolerans]